MTVLCITLITCIFLSFAQSCIRRYNFVKKIERSLKHFRQARQYYIEENNIQYLSDYADKDNYVEEPGNDFMYDEHGNINYGKNYVGAQRLPMSSRGINCKTFLKNYFNFSKQIRWKTLNNLKNNKENIHPSLLDLVIVLYNFENQQNILYNDLIEHMIMTYVNKVIMNATPQTQLSYFNELLYYLHYERATRNLKFFFCDHGRKFISY